MNHQRKKRKMISLDRDKTAQARADESPEKKRKMISLDRDKTAQARADESPEKKKKNYIIRSRQDSTGTCR